MSFFCVAADAWLDITTKHGGFFLASAVQTSGVPWTVFAARRQSPKNRRKRISTETASVGT